MTIGKKTGGRAPGTPNKATNNARQAIALFIDGNAHRLTGWLDAVAHGDPENDIKPNPAKAFDMFQSVVEYHIPKLARQEFAGDPNNPLRVEIQVEADNFLSTILKNAELNKQVDANE
jgi:hypothetical protein